MRKMIQIGTNLLWQLGKSLFVTLALICVVVTTAAGGKTSVEQFQESGLSVAVSPVWQPLSYYDESGNLAGFFIEYWRKWSEKTGIPVEFKTMTWAETLSSVGDGEADIHSGLYHTDERAEYLDYSIPFYHSSGTLAIWAKGGVECDDDFTKLRIGAVNKTYEHTYALSNFPQKNIIAYEDTRAMLGALKEQAVDALVIDYPTFVLIGGNMGITEEVTICKTLYRRELFSAVGKGRSDLLDVVNDGLSRFSKVEKDMIIERWFVVEQPKDRWLSVLFPAVLVLCFVGGVVFFWVNKRS